jgi:hypothetical protein
LAGLISVGFWPAEVLVFLVVMVHHAIDVMHVEKNVCEILVGILLDISGKIKDIFNERMNLEEIKLRKDLHHEIFKNW